MIATPDRKNLPLLQKQRPTRRRPSQETRSVQFFSVPFRSVPLILEQVSGAVIGLIPDNELVPVKLPKALDTIFSLGDHHEGVSFQGDCPLFENGDLELQHQDGLLFVDLQVFIRMRHPVCQRCPPEEWVFGEQMAVWGADLAGDHSFQKLFQVFCMTSVV